MLANIFRLFFGRTIVRERAALAAVNLLKERLVGKGFSHSARIPDSVLVIVVQEALRRAAEKEKDGYARSGRFFDQVEYAADNVIAAFSGDEDADPRIKSILIFHKVLPEPNASNARPEPAKE